MPIRDKYALASSFPFCLKLAEEANVNLELVRSPAGRTPASKAEYSTNAGTGRLMRRSLFIRGMERSAMRSRRTARDDSR